MVGNYTNLTNVLEQAKDHTKQIIKETKKEKLGLWSGTFEMPWNWRKNR